MSNQPKLIELAERCEKADAGAGNDLAYLDFDIHKALDPEMSDTYDLLDAPAYTASLDAAMTLVPEGCEPNLWWGRRHSKTMATAEIGDAVAIAATPALALCAAALRAIVLSCFASRQSTLS